MSLKSAASQSLAQSLKADLNEKFGLKLLNSEDVKPPRGAATGWAPFDHFTICGGFPCGEITFLVSPPGMGASTLWLQAAALASQRGRYCAWMEGTGAHAYQLNAVAAAQLGVDLGKLFLIGKPASMKQRLWVLQEILSSQLFELVGCDLGDARLPLRETRTLLMQARRSGTAVVLLARDAHNTPVSHPVASLFLHYHTDHVLIARAAHRPVPHSIKRSVHNVPFLAGPLDPSFLLAEPVSGDFLSQRDDGG